MPWGGTCKKREGVEELRYRSSLGPEGVEGATTLEGAQTVTDEARQELGVERHDKKAKDWTHWELNPAPPAS